jgi:hypothetical protein
VGLEEVEDLIADLQQAFTKIKEKEKFFEPSISL